MKERVLKILNSNPYHFLFRGDHETGLTAGEKNLYLKQCIVKFQ